MTKSLITPRSTIVVPRTVKIHDAVREVVKSECLQSSYTRGKRPYWAPSHYSKLMGKGKVLNADGSVNRLIDEEWMPNALANTGQAEDINVWLRGTAQVAGYYLGLTVISSATTNVPSATTVSANLTQSALAGGSTVTEAATADGYARQQVLQAGWGAPSLNGGGEQSAASQVTFGPASTGAWTGTTTQPAQIAYAMMSSGSATTTGTFILFLALAAATSIALTQSFAYTLTLKVT